MAVELELGCVVPEIYYGEFFQDSASENGTARTRAASHGFSHRVKGAMRACQQVPDGSKR